MKNSSLLLSKTPTGDAPPPPEVVAALSLATKFFASGGQTCRRARAANVLGNVFRG